VQDRLIELARQSLAVFGRVDPFVFAPDPQALRESETARPRDPDQLPKFRAAVGEVQRDPVAQGVLGANLRKAVEVCGEKKCPQQTYSIEVTKDERDAPESILYRWEVKDLEQPTDAQWQVFSALYTYEDPAARECQLPQAMNVMSRKSGTMAKKGHCADPVPNTVGAGVECIPPDGATWHSASLPGGGTCWMCY